MENRISDDELKLISKSIYKALKDGKFSYGELDDIFDLMDQAVTANP